MSRRSGPHFLMVIALLLLAIFGCTEDYDPGSIDLEEDNVIMSEDHWVNPEGTILIALDGSLYLDFHAGTVTEPTLFTIASIAIDDDPMEWNNSMDRGISITNTSQDLEFRDRVTIRMNYVPEAFQTTEKLQAENLTIYKLEAMGTLQERQVSIGECCVDCSGMTVEGCIYECGLYFVGEL